jgi:hypothetical protein
MAMSKPAALSLEDRIAIQTAPGWRPEKAGDKLEKVRVIGLRMHHDVNYGDTPVIIYRQQDNSVVALYCFHTVLRERMAELKTAVDMVQTVVYLGSQTSNTRVDSEGKPQRYESYYAENDGDEIEVVSTDFKF